MPQASATGKGAPTLIVKIDAVYAPMPMNAAFAIASRPHESVSQIDNARSALMPIVSTRLL